MMNEYLMKTHKSFLNSENELAGRPKFDQDENLNHKNLIRVKKMKNLMIRVQAQLNNYRQF